MNKVFKTLSILTIASFAASLVACGENSTASDSDENEIIAEQELSDDDELVDVSSSSKKSKASSSSEDESEEKLTDEEDTLSSSSEEESIDEENVASSSSKEKESSDSKEEKSGKFSGKISGVSQKGPFVVGAPVTLYEVEGESFDPSGRSFVSKIKNDKGEFEVSYKELSSNYAMFAVDGYYRNEVTGNRSVSPITLNALSDLTDRKTVNVNILTHLEFDRVKYLTTAKGVKYSEAKAQAEKEIFDAFGISFKEGASAEDLNIVGSTENDGALLALSVLMQGTSAEGAFSERLSLVAQDLVEDGTIDDKQILADIADEVALMDLAKVRKNVEGWKLSTTVPDFENYVETYWTTSYGIGACTKENVNDVAENSNQFSSNNGKKYVCDVDGWREMLGLEEKLGICTGVKEGTSAVDGGYYVCEGSQWLGFDRYTFDFKSLVCENDNEIVHSEANDIYYVCKNGKLTTPAFADLDINKDFSADLWDGAVDSKVNVDGNEYEVSNHVSYVPQSFVGKIYKENGDEVKYNDITGAVDYPVYDESGVSSTLNDKGVKYSYAVDGKAIVDDKFYMATRFLFSNEKIDVREWNGVCIVYASTVPLYVWGFNRNSSKAISRIPASTKLSIANIKWEKMESLDIVQTLSGIFVEVERDENNNMVASLEGTVYIAGIGKYNGCSVK